MPRTDLVERLIAAVGPDDVRLVGLRDGWPSVLAVRVSGEEVLVSAHVSRVSSMSRRPEEIRFQNPSNNRPIQSIAGSMPLLLGIAGDQDQPVIVGADASRRLGFDTRFSVLFRKSLVRGAAAHGWARYSSSTQEDIYAFRPFLFPLYVDIRRHSLDLKETDLIRLVDASGQLDDSAAQDRARIATLRLSRDERFRKTVVLAYEERCAMCGLDLALVVAAHILPVAAPNSRDIVSNGIALCENHHRFFDSHRVWISPESLEVHLHPQVKLQAGQDPISRQFVDSFKRVLWTPPTSTLRPDPQMFRGRYDYYRDAYRWQDA